MVLILLPTHFQTSRIGQLPQKPYIDKQPVRHHSQWDTLTIGEEPPMAQDILESTTPPVSERVASGLGKIAQALRSHAWKEAGERKLTPTQGQIISSLANRRSHPMRLNDIADQLRITPATASEAVGSLHAKGLIRKDVDPKDARALSIVLTAKGRSEAERVGEWPQFLSSAIGALPEDEQETFLRLIHNVLHSLQQQNTISISRMCATCDHFRPNHHDDGEKPHHCTLMNEAFGDRLLRLDCSEHVLASTLRQEENWTAILPAQR